MTLILLFIAYWVVAFIFLLGLINPKQPRTHGESFGMSIVWPMTLIALFIWCVYTGSIKAAVYIKRGVDKCSSA